MKIKAYIAALAMIAGISAIPAYAATPSYQVVQNGAIAQITVTTTDVNAPVVLYYYPQNSSTVASAGTIGSTNSTGYFTSSVTSSTYSIPSGANTYVTVNGTPSATMPWPYFTGGVQGSVYLSQNSVSMSTGQNSTITISGGNGSYYVSSNSGSGIVNPTISASSLNLYAQNSGSATIVVCSSGAVSTGASCANLFVTVGGTNGSNLQLSQTNLNITIGQVSLVTAQNSSNGNLFVSSNSNPNVVTVTASGNAAYITGNALGYSTVTLCNTSGFSSCGTVYVTVTQAYNTGSQSVTLAQNSVTAYVGQSQSVAIYGSGNYYISSNSNPNVVSASVVGGPSVILQGITPGSSTISICSNQYAAYGSSCATLYVTVNSNYYNGGYVAPTYPGYLQPQQAYYPSSSYSAGSGAVYLSQVPYTGIADDAKLLAFVSMIVAFSALGAYIIVGKKVFA